MIKNEHWSLCKSVRYSCLILITLEFSPQIVEKFSNTKLYGNSPLGTELFEADRRTDEKDMTKITVVFRNFANAPKKSFVLKYNRDRQM